jgi:predicted nucleic acid-binding protein
MTSRVGRPHLDAGALIALDRADPQMWARLRRMTSVRGTAPLVSAPVVAQVGGSGRQANLARALGLCKVVPTSDEIALRAGQLLAATGGDDAVDAIVVATAEQHGGAVYTSDPSDIGALAEHVRRVAVIAV